MRAAAKIALTALLLAIGAIWPYASFKRHGLSARERPFALEAYIARHVRSLALPAQAGASRNPVSPGPETVAYGAQGLVKQCAVCHAIDGSGKTDIGLGLYPAPPNLRQPATQDLSDGALFYIIKNGIRFTGMPSWNMQDDQIWTMVTFIRALPHLSSEEIELLIRPGKALGDTRRLQPPIRIPSKQPDPA